MWRVDDSSRGGYRFSGRVVVELLVSAIGLLKQKLSGGEYDFLKIADFQPAKFEIAGVYFSI